ncbi:MAG: polysulfide reductase NrfD [Candidatus Rokubacteria bacterium]|nr:polysulfide reductase NrfD [Candidatus Rokubacteria bacterium]
MGKNPVWSWYIIWYFFVGGVAAGAYVTAAFADFFGRKEDRQLAKVGFAIAFPLVLICSILLILDLGVPGRALNMFRLFNWSSPMSVGSWVLLGFGLVSLVSLILVLWDRRGAWRIRRVLAIPGALFGLFIASYTGVLLGATNRPIWAANNWIGPLFLVSALSTGVAALALFSARAKLTGFRQVHLFATGFEALLLVLFLQSLGAGATLFLTGSFAPLFWGGVVAAGLAIPFGFAFLPRGRAVEAVAAILVLAGGLALRYLVVTGGQT